MSTATHDERLDRRVHELIATDPQFAAAQPDPAITAALEQPGLRLPQIIRTVLDGYADRPALGQRVVEFVTDAKTGRTSAQLLPRFETITYSEVAQRVSALGRALSDDAVHPGDRVCVLGFNSVDYATIDMALGAIGAVSVPLQTSAAISSLQPIVAETEPTLIASSVNQLSDAVQLITGAEQAPTRLVVFDYHPQVDDQREAVQDAAARLSSTGVAVQTLAELLERGKDLPAVAEPPADEDSLALLIYTSGSTGAPKGAMYPQSNVGKMWRRGSKNWFGESAASITLNFMPMSHVMGRSILYGTLGNGGTAYFAARSDLSTLLEDLELVRPTELNFVPRIWETLYGEFQRQVERRLSEAGDAGERRAVEAEVLAEQRQYLLGGRFTFAMTGSAPISPELRNWSSRCSKCT